MPLQPGQIEKELGSALQLKKGRLTTGGKEKKVKLLLTKLERSSVYETDYKTKESIKYRGHQKGNIPQSQDLGQNIGNNASKKCNPEHSLFPED